MRSEAAILYRSNAQSRVLEEVLLRSQIPYKIYGGQRFFERMEIKNVLAYAHSANQNQTLPLSGLSIPLPEESEVRALMK